MGLIILCIEKICTSVILYVLGYMTTCNSHLHCRLLCNKLCSRYHILLALLVSASQLQREVLHKPSQLNVFHSVVQYTISRMDAQLSPTVQLGVESGYMFMLRSCHSQRIQWCQGLHEYTVKMGSLLWHSLSFWLQMSEPITHKNTDITWLFIIKKQVTLIPLHIWRVLFTQF